MSLTADLPLSQTVAPATVEEVADMVRAAGGNQTPIYPIGGGTSLRVGLPARKPGIGLSMTSMAQVIDYPARDMTITVVAGIRMTDLAALLASQRQRLPIDVPQVDRATLGGIVATNFS